MHTARSTKESSARNFQPASEVDNRATAILRTLLGAKKCPELRSLSQVRAFNGSATPRGRTERPHTRVPKGNKDRGARRAIEAGEPPPQRCCQPGLRPESHKEQHGSTSSGRLCRSGPPCFAYSPGAKRRSRIAQGTRFHRS